AVSRRAYGGGATKLVFGRGTRLTSETRNQYQPSFYKLENGNNSVCLATGFSQFRQLGNHSLFNQTEAVRISQDSLFNQVAFMTSGTNLEDCEEDAGGPTRCDDALQPDPMVNLVSLVVTGLRV
uniref:Uncharacterized protein n=1 Tax=Tetraodon nigroviridis TaxID=99883 RepID=H3BZ78_TETNG